MPSRNRSKIYVKKSYYHIYNRGVAKQDIYKDEQDYKVFLSYIKTALTDPPDLTHLQGPSLLIRLPINFQNEISLISFSLMPNHFHLLIKQNNKNSMESFMRSIATRYSSYFNKKYDRVGPLFQGRYKAVLVNNDRYLLHLSRYIHLNPSEYTNDLVKAYSSYADYLDLRRTSWIKPDIILKFFNEKTILEITKVNSYKSFVENYKKDSSEVLGKLTLE